MTYPKPNDLGLLIPEWREGQYEAILNSVNSKKRFVGQCMPTGGGKSHVLVGESRLSKRRTLILTGTKALQDQYAAEFKNLGIIDVRGKSNYRCIATEFGGQFYDGDLAKSVADAPCQFGIECGLKVNGCTYYDRLRQASFSNLVVTNYAAWISSNLYSDGWGQFQLIMCDEAHEAERWIANMLVVKVPNSYKAVLNTDFPRERSNPNAWLKWAQELLPVIRFEIKNYKEVERRSRRGKVKANHIKALVNAERTLSKLKMVDGEWLVIQAEDHVTLHPVWVRRYTESLLFTKAPKVVLASATIVPKTLYNLGIDKSSFDFFSYPSTFPVKNRPIYFYPAVKMNKDNTEEEAKKWIGVADAFISHRQDRKGLIHSVSFARQRQIMQYTKWKAQMVVNSSSSAMETEGTLLVLKKFKASPPPKCLVSPSIATGVSFDGKLAEYAIIPKIPFGNPTDPVLLEQQKEDKDRGAYDTAQTLVQTIGRIVRSAQDQGETLITDIAFLMFMNRYRKLIPDWIWDAVIVIDELPIPLKRLE